MNHAGSRRPRSRGLIGRRPIEDCRTRCAPLQDARIRGRSGSRLSRGGTDLPRTAAGARLKNGGAGAGRAGTMSFCNPLSFKMHGHETRAAWRRAPAGLFPVACPVLTATRDVLAARPLGRRATPAARAAAGRAARAAQAIIRTAAGGAGPQGPWSGPVGRRSWGCIRGPGIRTVTVRARRLAHAPGRIPQARRR
jgi:hypothetical protein